MSGLKYESQDDGESQYKVEPAGVSVQSGYAHSTSTMHVSAARPSPSSLNKRSDSSGKNPELRTQTSQVNQATVDFSNSSIKKEQGMPGREPGMVNSNLLLIMSFLVLLYIIMEPCM